MADNLVRNIAPFINVRFLVTSEFGEERSYEKHPGMDLATPTSLGHVELYSILNGIVLDKGTSSSAGNWLCIKDNDPDSPEYGLATLYMHMNALSLIPKGTKVNKGDYVGNEGSSGHSTGIHLDIRMQNLTNRDNWYWEAPFSFYLNPADFMGIDNIEGKWWIYNGTPGPGPIFEIPKKPFPWFLYRKKRHNMTI